MIVPALLAGLVAACATHVGPITMNAVIAYESGDHPFAIGDNTVHRSYFPSSAPAAAAIAGRLLGAGHNIDVGYAQINSVNFARFGFDTATAFEPCANIAAGARILRDAYAGAARTYGPGQVALVHALSAYNTGGYWAGLGYAHGVYATAASLHYAVPPDAPDVAVRGVRAVSVRHVGDAR